MKVLSLVVLAAWILALARTLVNLALVPRLRARLPRRLPLVSVVVPARNEERAIEGAVSGLLAQTYPNLEIIVVNDRSADATGAILARLASSDARLVVVSGEEPPAGWLGKPWALQQGSLRATGEYLLFVDADVIYSPDAVAAAVAQVEESGTAMAALLPRMEMRGFWEHIAMPYLAVVAWIILPLWLSNRTRWPLLAVGGGPGNLVRRSDYEALGRHEQLRDAVIDDIGLARLLRANGLRTEVLRADDMISVRMYHGLGEVVAGFTKNLFSALDRSYLMLAGYLALLLVFHVLPFALALAGDPVAIATVATISLARLVLFRSLEYRLDNALLGHLPMVVIWLWIALRSAWLTGVRRRLQWRGRTYDAGRTRFGGER